MAAHPDAGAIDAAPPAVDEHAVDHHVEELLPAVDLVVAQQDLRKARAVRLDPRVATVSIDRGGAAENQVPPATIEHRGADVAFTGIDRDGLARNAGLKEGLRHPVRRPRLLRTWFEHQTDLQRNDRQP